MPTHQDETSQQCLTAAEQRNDAPPGGGELEIHAIASALMAAWAKAEPESPITRYPVSYLATFVDLAKAVNEAHVTRLHAEVERLTDSLANHDSASKLMDAWVAEKGKMPWVTAINILAVTTHMPDEERQRLLDMDDGSTERGALIAERDALQSELTKAQELLGGVCDYANGLLSDVNSAWEYAGSTGKRQLHRDEDYLAAIELLSNQSAPAAKDGEA